MDKDEIINKAVQDILTCATSTIPLEYVKINEKKLGEILIQITNAESLDREFEEIMKQKIKLTATEISVKTDLNKINCRRIAGLISDKEKDILTFERLDLSLDQKKKMIETVLTTIWLNGKCDGIKELAAELK